MTTKFVPGQFNLSASHFKQWTQSPHCRFKPDDTNMQQKQTQPNTTETAAQPAAATPAAPAPPAAPVPAPAVASLVESKSKRRRTGKIHRTARVRDLAFDMLDDAPLPYLE